jgi:hypothetical protein
MMLNVKFRLSTPGVPLYVTGVEYAAQATMEGCRPGKASQTAGFASQTGEQFILTGWAQKGSLSGMLLQPFAIVTLISVRD